MSVRLSCPPETDPNGRDPHQSGAKLDAGKNRLSLVMHGFPRALQAVGHVATYGAEKYTPNGWRDVPNGIERYSAPCTATCWPKLPASCRTRTPACCMPLIPPGTHWRVSN